MKAREILKEQRAAYWAGLELPNGRAARLGLYVSRILRDQDLVAWQGDPVGFDRWLKGAICDYVNNSCYGVIRSKSGGGK